MKFIALTIIPIAAVLFFWQRSCLTDLREDLAEEQTRADLRGDSSSSTEATPNRRLSKPSPSIIRGTKDPIANQHPPLQTLLALAPKEATPPFGVEFIRALPSLLDAFGDSTSAELFALLQEIDMSGDSSPQSEFLSRALLLLVSQVEPERTLTWLEEHPNVQERFPELLPTTFASLARHNPERAHQLLSEGEDWSARKRSQAEAALLLAWAQSDFPKALDFLRTRSWKGDNANLLRILSSLTRDANLRPQVIKALASEENKELHSHLSIKLASSTYFESGLEGVENFVADITFPSATSRDEVIRKVASWALLDQPEEATEWLIDNVSARSRANLLGSQIRVWANEDFAGAGEWLKTQQPSNENSKAYSEYAMALRTIDPAAAVQWADRIANPRLKKATRRFLIDDWRRRDPEGAPK